MKIKEKIKKYFYINLAKVIDLRHLKKFPDYPIAYSDTQDLEIPKEWRVLYEWKEGGRRYICFIR